MDLSDFFRKSSPWSRFVAVAVGALLEDENLQFSERMAELSPEGRDIVEAAVTSPDFTAVDSLDAELASDPEAITWLRVHRVDVENAWFARHGDQVDQALHRLRVCADLALDLDHEMTVVVDQLRRCDADPPVSWADIGRATRTSAQAAHKRYHQRRGIP